MTRKPRRFCRATLPLRLAAAATALVVLTGCRAILGPDEDERPSDLPWSEPAGWESQGMGVPY